MRRKLRSQRPARRPMDHCFTVRMAGGADVSSALSFEHTKRLIHEAASACTAASQHDVGI